MISIPGKIRLVGFDLDDTALDSGKQLTPGVAGAIAAALRAGVVVLPATGRQLDGIPPAVLGIPGIRYAVVANGAGVYDLQEGRRLYSDCFAAAPALALLEQLRDFDAMVSVYTGSRSYAEPYEVERLQGVLSPPMVAYLRDCRELVPSLSDFIRERDCAVDKFSVHFPSAAERQRALAFFSRYPGATVTSSLPTNIEINTRTANKGAALLALGESLGIPQREVMAVGDSSNDIAMLRAVGFSVAMANAEDAVKQAADAVTTRDCDHDGLAEALAGLAAR